MQQYIRSRRTGPTTSILPLSYDTSGYSKTAKGTPKGRPWLLKAAAGSLCCGLLDPSSYLPPIERRLGLLATIHFKTLLFVLWLVPPILKAIETSKTPDFDSEMVFDTGDGTTAPFPSLLRDPAELTVSVVVPAYNEEERMPAAMDEMLDFLKMHQHTHPTFTWEVIIVNDGSKDGTADAALGLTRKEGPNHVRLLQMHKNSGKGAAVRKGALRARGEYVLMADADGATRASDLAALLEGMAKVERDGYGIAIGSRAHLESDAKPSEATGGDEAAHPVAKRSALRRLLMGGFHTFVSVMVGGAGIKDTQCGFKLFTRKAAQAIFSVLHIERWAFDVELVYLAARKGIPMVEVPVNWQEMAGSKVDVVSDSLKMARDIIVIRLCYMLGLWSDTSSTAIEAALGPSPSSIVLRADRPSPAPESEAALRAQEG